MLRGFTRHAEQRLAHLLFMTQDRVDCGILRITHDFFSTMLGTDPDIVVLGCSGIRAVSSFISAILADLAIRAFASSFVMLASNALPIFFLVCLRSIHPP